MSGINILRRLLLTDAVKKSGQASGIMSIGDSVRKLADKRLQSYLLSAQKQGVDLDKLSEQEIKYMLELNKPKAPRVFSNEEAYKFLKQFLSQGKGKSEVVKFPKDKIKDVTKAKSRPPETEIIKGIQTTKGLGDLFPKQLEKTVTVRTVIEDIKKLKPIESMKETNRVLKGEGKYKNLSKADREKIANDESVNDHIFERNIIDETEDFADGGVAGLLGERQNFSMGRRAFLKLMGAAGAGIGAAKAGLGSLFKGSKPIVKDLTSVPIENAEGMPAWFKPLVNRVIKEGVETTKLPPNKGGAYLDRQIVHSAKLGEGQGVRVYQNLDDQTIRVEYQSVDNMGGIDDVVSLDYTAPQVIKPPIIQSGKLSGYGKGVKTKPEFSAEEAFPHGTTGDYKDITMEGSNVVNKVKDLYSDTSALKQFGTNKTLSKKELEIAKQKRQRVNEINNDLHEQNQLLPEPPDYDDFASGGRVPMFLGGGLTAGKGLLKQIMRHHEKTGTTGLKGSEMLKLVNPKQFNEMLNSPEGIPSIAREMIKKYKKEMKADRIGAVDHSLGLAKKMKKGKINIAEMKEQAIKDLVEKKGLDKKMVEDLIDIFGAQKIKELPKVTDEGILELETILKNLSTEGRKLNASGGVARLLGE